MILIVGLGNPGEKYKNNRHNVGFMVLDVLAAMSKVSWEKSKKAQALYTKYELDGQTVEFIKPDTFMNNSGVAVSYAKNKHKVPLNDLFVIHDDLDIKLGEYKIQKAVGPKDHNGINSVVTSLRSDQFWRVRIGVDNRDPVNRIPGDAYVLQNFNEKELNTLQTVIENVTKELTEHIKNR